MDYQFYHSMKKFFGHLMDPILVIDRLGKIKFKNAQANLLLAEKFITDQLNISSFDILDWLSVRKKQPKNPKKTILTISNSINENYYLQADITYLERKNMFVLRILSISKDFKVLNHDLKSYEKLVDIFSEFKQALIISDGNGRVLSYNNIASNQFQLSNVPENIIQYEEIIDKFDYDINEMIAYYKNIGLHHYGELNVSIIQNNEKYNLKIISFLEEESKMLITTFLNNKQSNMELSTADSMLKSIGENTAKIMHEIHNPLTTLKGYVQLLLKEGNSNAEYLAIIEKELNVLQTLTSDILYLSKPKDDNFSAISIIPIVKECVDLLQGDAIRVNCLIQMHYEIDKDYTVISNPIRLRQILVNLIKNAIEAMEEAQKSGMIDVYIEQCGEYCKIVIMDNGPGIEQEVINQIFQPFFTTKFKGTGLGLSISQQFIRDQRGKIEVESSIGIGTTFTVHLPLYVAGSIEDYNFNSLSKL